MTRILRSALICAFAAGLSGEMPAQTPQRAGPAWRVESRAHADLWFHGLAMVGFEGFAPLPLSSADYADRMRAAKRAACVYPTPLDTLVSRLQSAFERTALEQEWSLFLERHWSAQRSTRARRIEGIGQLWDQELAPALLPFLERRQLDAGIVLASEALGPEGRVFGADPRDRTANVVAIHLPTGGSDARPGAYAVVRELCYPMVSRLVAASDLPGGDRIAAERISSRGAVRCGAMLLDAHAPAHGSAYRRFFVAAAGEQNGSSGRFEQTYPLDPSLLENLRQAVRR
jgi:hypothetical protein